jgi:subtilisin family serine protease
MKVKLIIISIILLLVMVFACGCIPVMEKLGLVNPANEEQLSPEKGGPPDGLVKVLIGFKEKPGAAQQAMVKGVGGKIKYTYNLIPAIAASVPDVAIEALKKNPNITNVELDSMVFALDTELENSWGVNRIGAGFVHDGGNKGTNVNIAIIDSGIDKYHEDLTVAGGKSFVDYTDDFNDDDGHGTHVAGIVAALDNNIGVVGVAPEANLYALKALNSEGVGYVSDVVLAIQWATENGIQVINMSLGGRKNIFLELACNLAYYDYDLLLVAAAGNGGAVIYPAAYSSVIAVSATDEYDNLASFSSTGKQVELAAPGVDINSTLPGNTYSDDLGETWSGTSMASPHVAGTAALVWAANLGWTNDEVRTQLQSTAEDIGLSTREQGYGLVDAAEAAGVGIPPPGTGTIEGNVTGADTELAIGGASVVVEGTDLSATTDSNGYYEITDVAEGTYTVTASADGYESVSQYDVVVSADTITSDVNFTLSPLSETSTMYVESIVFSSKVAGPNNFLYTTVKVVDDSFSALADVRVEMELE